MNIFARAVYWALPFWAGLFLLQFVQSPYTFVQQTVDGIIYPGHMICLWLAGNVHDIGWFTVIVVNMLLVYLVVVLVVFVCGKIAGGFR